MIKVIIFDFGGVIVIGKSEKGGIKNISHLLSPVLKLPKEKISSAFIQYWGPWKLGKINKKQFWASVLKKLKLENIKQSEIDKVLVNESNKNKNIIRLIKKLRRNYKIALLSNHSRWWFQVQFKKLKLKSLFNNIFVSYKLKIAKPDKRIFRLALKKLKVKPNEVVFIDDIKKNVDSASKLGIHGIHYKGYSNLIKNLKAII